MPGETVRDERPQDPEQAFKINTYIPALVSIQSEFRDRFTTATVDVMREMQFFMPNYLLSDQPAVRESNITTLCTFYEMDPVTVVYELAEFRPVFRKIHLLVNVDDLINDSNLRSRMSRMTIAYMKRATVTRTMMKLKMLKLALMNNLAQWN